MHIVYVLPSLDIGGMEQFVLQLSGRMRGRGHECTVVCTSHEGVLSDAVRANGVPVVVARFERGMDNVFPRRLARVLRDLKPSIIHTQSGVWLGGARAAQMAGIPSVHTEHGLDSLDEPWQLRLHKVVAARLNRRIVAVSGPLRQVIAWQTLLPLERILQIDNGIEVAQFARTATMRGEVRRELDLADNALVFGAVARFDHLKGVDLLMDALGSIDVPDLPVSVVVAGDGRERADIERRAEASKVPVRLLGMRGDVQRLLQAVDVFVLPSRSEGLPLAILEAMAAGCCVVASRVGEVPSVLQEGDCGLLVDVGDVDGLSKALTRVARDPALRSRLASRGTAHVVSRYSIERMSNDYEAVYSQLI